MAVDASFLDQVKHLHFVIRKKVSALYTGGRPSTKYGSGIEPLDYREYFPGDDFRNIDWKVYGRTEKLYIRRFEEDKNLILHLLVDSSKSMDFGLKGNRKFDYASNLAAGFGFLTVVNNEEFGIGLYSKQLMQTLGAERTKTHLFQTIDILNNAKLEGETNFGTATSQYSRMIKSKSFIVVLSDFLEPMDSLKEGILRIAKQSKELIMIQVLDPGEVNLEWSEDVNFEDMESGGHKRTFLSPNFKKEYNERVTEHIKELNGICDDVGADFHSVRTNTPIFDCFVSLLGGGRSHV
ncbi:MAG: DUF58 domain-containing protein [Candidatus Altiarchaeota archaeon]